MNNVTARMVEDLKSQDMFFAAGALQNQLGHALAYGCHYGMRSTRDSAVAEFRAGWLAADDRLVER